MKKPLFILMFAVLISAAFFGGQWTVANAQGTIPPAPPANIGGELIIPVNGGTTTEITIPEKRLETLWFYGLYKLASSSRAGHLPANLQGLWVRDGVLRPRRGDYTVNTDEPEQYQPSYTGP